MIVFLLWFYFQKQKYTVINATFAKGWQIKIVEAKQSIYKLYENLWKVGQKNLHNGGKEFRKTYHVWSDWGGVNEQDL